MLHAFWHAASLLKDIRLKHRSADKPAKFGAILGIASGGVPVYSSDYDTADRVELPTRQSFQSHVDGVYMGHKWQCVELARRWMYINKGYVFDDIAMAYDIFRLRSVRVVADESQLPLQSFRNGARRPPEPGALMIWKEGGEFDVTGHVAVVSEVLPDRVRIIEQNVHDTVWGEGQNWSRELPMHQDSDGGFHVSCTYPDSDLLGWVIQTDDPTHAEAVLEDDPRLFVPQLRSVADCGQAEIDWLDKADDKQAAYIELNKGCRLATHDEHLFQYFCISETALRELRRATNELHRMFLHATNYVLEHEELLHRFNLPPVLWPRIRQSWSNRRGGMITGRFDFALNEGGVKAYEYNADSASCHMECGYVQGRWGEHFGCGIGDDAGEDLHERLVEAWRQSGVDDVLHILQDRDLEETYHALYMKSAAEAAGIPCKVVHGVSSLQWDEDAWVCDADGVRIKWVWKTWAWETALDQIRHELTDDAEELRLNHKVDHRTHRPRLVDVLLREEVMVFEPLWTLVTSNKAILPVVQSIFPSSRFLLNSSYELTDELRRTGYVAKPIVGRWGSNISIVNRNEDVVAETTGQFEAQDQIFQELFRLPVIDGHNVQIGTFSVNGTYGGACVRVDESMIIGGGSDLLPLRVISDEEFLAYAEAETA